MKRIDSATFLELLRLHELWLKEDPAGKQANFANTHVANDDPNGLLIDAKFKDLHLVDFSGSRFIGVDFKGSNFIYANCAGASFVACNFTSVILSFVLFSNVKPINSVFCNTEFFGTDIRCTNFDDSQISGAATSRTMLRVGPIYGEMMTAVRWPDGPRISYAGDWYTVRQAKVRCASDARERAGLYALLGLVRAYGWASI